MITAPGGDTLLPQDTASGHGLLPCSLQHCDLLVLSYVLDTKLCSEIAAYKVGKSVSLDHSAVLPGKWYVLQKRSWRAQL